MPAQFEDMLSVHFPHMPENPDIPAALRETFWKSGPSPMTINFLSGRT